MRKWMALVLVVAVSALCPILEMFDRVDKKAGAVSEIEPPPDEFVIQVPLGGSVFLKTFTHREHVDYQIPCKVCHHLYDGEKNIWEEKMPVKECAECHKAETLGVEEETVTGFLMKRLISHQSCSRCHKGIAG